MIIWDRGAHGVTSIMFNDNYGERALLCSLGGLSPTRHGLPASAQRPSNCHGLLYPIYGDWTFSVCLTCPDLPPQRARLPLQASPEVCLPSSISSCPVGCPSRPHCSLDPLLQQKVSCPREAWPLQALGGNEGERPPLSFSVLRFPPTVIKITSFCYNLNIPTSHKGLYYTRVTPGPRLHRKAHGRSPLLTK